MLQRIVTELSQRYFTVFDDIILYKSRIKISIRRTYSGQDDRFIMEKISYALQMNNNMTNKKVYSHDIRVFVRLINWHLCRLVIK